MKYILITIILIAVFLGGYVIWGLVNNEEKQAAKAEYEEIYPEKVVYGTSPSQDIKILREDCKERGGEFNTCGNICAPEAEMCAQVCAYTCEL